MSQARTYRGVSLEQRRDDRRAALLETGLNCLADDGLSGVSVRSICAGSKLTPRYFYESFSGLDELLVAIIDMVCAEVAATAVDAILKAPDDMRAQVRAGIDAGYGVAMGDRRKANAMLVAASGHGPLRDRRQQLFMEYVDLILATLPRLGELKAADRNLARATALFMMGGACDLIEAVLSGSLRMSRKRLVDLLTDLWVEILEGSARDTFSR